MSRHLASVLFSAVIIYTISSPLLILPSYVSYCSILYALYFSDVSICKILGFRTGVAEESSALGCYAMLTGNFLSCVS